MERGFLGEMSKLNKDILREELIRVKKRMQLISSFKRYGDSLSESRQKDAEDFSALSSRQKELTVLLRSKEI